MQAIARVGAGVLRKLVGRRKGLAASHAFARAFARVGAIVFLEMVGLGKGHAARRALVRAVARVRTDVPGQEVGIREGLAAPRALPDLICRPGDLAPTWGVREVLPHGPLLHPSPTLLPFPPPPLPPSLSQTP